MSPAFRYALLWIVGTTLIVVFALMQLQQSYVDGVYGPAHADAFYHARRILDAVMTGQPVAQFDARIHVPEGSWITWPWAFDSALAHITRLFGPFADENAANRVLMRLPIFLGVIYITVVLLVTRVMRLSFLSSALLIIGAAMLPVLHVAFAVGDLDHHGAESTWTAMTMAAGIWFFSTRGRIAPAITLGVVLGTALGVHNSLFILQIPVVGLLLLRWLRAQELPGRRETLWFAGALLGTTLLVCAPSQPWQRGFFEFYTLSWFHTYIALCTSAFSVLFVYLERRPRNVAITCVLALVAIVPIVGALGLAQRFVTGTLDSIQGVVEVFSPYQLLAMFNEELSTRLYSWLLFLSGPFVLLNVWFLYRQRDAGIQFFAMMAAIGLVLLQIQYRFHMFGELAMIATPLVAAKLAAERWPHYQRRIGVVLVAFFVVVFYPTHRHWTIHWTLGTYTGYAQIRSVFPFMHAACARRPGVVLTGIDAGHWVRYHSACSVIGDAFLLTPQHAAKAHLTADLMKVTPEQLMHAPIKISYVFVHHAIDLWPGVPERNFDELRGRMQPLEARLLGPLEGLPPQYKVLWEGLTPKRQIYGRLFEITDTAEPAPPSSAPGQPGKP
jgi:hypothetical protein